MSQPQQQKGFGSTTMTVTNNCFNDIGVVGCGHYFIPSTKSNICFPAFLLCLPQLSSVTREPQSTVVSTMEYQYRWRSKRDFLLIKHAATSYYKTKQRSSSSSSSSTSQQLLELLLYPKSALDKLCDRAITQGSWIRPNFTFSSNSSNCGVGFNAVNKITSNSNRSPPQDCINSNLVTTAIIDDSIPKTYSTFDSNSYCKEMKKSLQAVDDYLRQMYQIYCSCLVLQPSCAEEVACYHFKEAFETFCHEQDPAGITRNTNHALVSEDKKKSLGSAVTSSLLGQYFASNENIDYVSTRCILFNCYKEICCYV
jgi:hypothetical protein